VLGSVLCAPGCFSVYRVKAVRDIVSTYASTVEKAFDFLIKDMGEDRWFCTLMVGIILINNNKFILNHRCGFKPRCGFLLLNLFVFSYKGNRMVLNTTTEGRDHVI